MPLKDLLKKHQKIREDVTPTPVPSSSEPAGNFVFMRTDTNTQELIQPPSFPVDGQPPVLSPIKPKEKRLSRFRSSSDASIKSHASTKSEKRLSSRLHLHSRTNSASSVNVPEDLPEIGDETGVETEEREAKWEERATILATKSLGHGTPEKPATQQQITQTPEHTSSSSSSRPPSTPGAVSDALSDETIQEAIRLHEAGQLSESTAMFSRLASTNAMAQILYGLALRHGWGCEPNPALGVTYLSRAASNTAAIESVALHSGKKKGGAAKGELVLAVYELANSFRQGWGVERDPVAARKYYEVAANLGDTDAMNEVARCFEEGFGGGKDKVSAASILQFSMSSFLTLLHTETAGDNCFWSYCGESPKDGECLVLYASSITSSFRFPASFVSFCKNP